MAKKQSIDANAVPQGKVPSVVADMLAGKPANEFSFRVNAIDQVKVKVQQGSKPVAKSLPALPAAATGFTPHRLVINLGFVQEADESKAVTTFSTPFELRLRYYADDISAAGGSSQLKAAYYAQGSWITLEVVAEADANQPDEGYLRIATGNWPADPPLAIGR